MILPLLAVVYSFHIGSPKVSVIINDSIESEGPSMIVSEGDRVSLRSDVSVWWYRINPVKKEYLNTAWGKKRSCALSYVPEPITDRQAIGCELGYLKPGTYYFAAAADIRADTFTADLPLHLLQRSVIQIVVQKDTTYVGYLTELLGVPFVLPPILLPGYGHQTDLRVGTDCAELAIYGIRRMGYPLSYLGPRRVRPYLKPETQLRTGSIIYFGFQVSILYEDRGIIGVVDEEDLLIHAHQDAVKIQSFASSGLWGNQFQVLQWDLSKLPLRLRSRHVL